MDHELKMYTSEDKRFCDVHCYAFGFKDGGAPDCHTSNFGWCDIKKKLTEKWDKCSVSDKRYKKYVENLSEDEK